MGIHSRRELLRGFRDALLGRSATGVDPKPPRLDFVRPPGAIAEKLFLKTCERCHACIRACPHDVIARLGPPFGAGRGTPAIFPRSRACRLCQDVPCSQACPSGALQPILQEEIHLGTAVLDPEHCWRAKGQPCDYCVLECPFGSKAIELAEGGVMIHPETCNGCGLCVEICTATPGALRVQHRSEAWRLGPTLPDQANPQGLLRSSRQGEARTNPARHEVAGRPQ